MSITELYQSPELRCVFDYGAKLGYPAGNSTPLRIGGIIPAEEVNLDVPDVGGRYLHRWKSHDLNSLGYEKAEIPGIGGIIRLFRGGIIPHSPAVLLSNYILDSYRHFLLQAGGQTRLDSPYKKSGGGLIYSYQLTHGPDPVSGTAVGLEQIMLADHRLAYQQHLLLIARPDVHIPVSAPRLIA